MSQLGFLERHNLSLNSIKKRLSAFANLNVGVIGDVIVDEYIECVALGMSTKITRRAVPNSSQQFVGGAGIVACHSHGLGANVTLLSVIGDDDTGTMVEETLAEEGVEPHCS